MQCDLADIANVQAATDQIKQKTDRIHIMICNAGWSPAQRTTSAPINRIVLGRPGRSIRV